MQLPQFQDSNRVFQMMQNAWAAILNPLISNPINNSSILKNVSLAIGSNTINHKLGQKLQGWSIVRKRGAASIYDNQDSNQTPNLTLILVSDANVTIDLAVY